MKGAGAEDVGAPKLEVEEGAPNAGVELVGAAEKGKREQRRLSARSIGVTNDISNQALSTTNDCIGACR